MLLIGVRRPLAGTPGALALFDPTGVPEVPDRFVPRTATDARAVAAVMGHGRSVSAGCTAPSGMSLVLSPPVHVDVALRAVEFQGQVLHLVDHPVGAAQVDVGFR